MPQAQPPKEDPAPAPRVAAVDGLRGLLAVVVLAWHVASPFGVNWLLTFANIAVAQFFLLSGYVLTRGWEGRIAIFLVRRFLRLWPVYALCLFAGYLIAGVQPVWSEFFWYPFIGPNDRPAIDPPVWSLFLEAWVMPLMPLIVWAGTASPRRALLCAGAMMLANLMVPQLAVVALFIAGAFLSRATFRNTLLESAVPQALGRISYSLYLSHFLVLEVFVRAFGPWGGVAAVPAAFLVAWLVWRCVERPSILLSRGAGHAMARYLAPYRGVASA